MQLSENKLIDTAKALVADNKGILAADESTGTIGKRFASISLPNTPENRRAYRTLLFGTKGLGKYISGAILFDETIREPGMIEALQREGIIPGIKVDAGVSPLTARTAYPGETWTQGLEGLPGRLAEYAQMGAKFAKWRAVLSINEVNSAPSEIAIQVNSSGLAQYASACQAAGLVPIVEPEILMDGPHSLEMSARVAEHVLSTVYHVIHKKVNFTVLPC